MLGIERETQFLYNAVEDVAVVSTFETSVKRKILKLAEERPDEVRVVRGNIEDTESEFVAEIPKKWVKIKASRILSEEQKEALKERGRTLYEALKAKTLPVSQDIS